MKQILPWSLSLIITYLILSRAYLFQLGMEVDLPSKHREQSVVTQGMAPPPLLLLLLPKFPNAYNFSFPTPSLFSLLSSGRKGANLIKFLLLIRGMEMGEEMGERKRRNAERMEGTTTKLERRKE